jgi:hypothetical protein
VVYPVRIYNRRMDVDELQKMIDELFADSNLDERVFLANKVIFSEGFDKATLASSEKLGVPPRHSTHPIYGKKLKNKNKLYEDQKAVGREVDMLMKQFSLPIEWREFVSNRVVKPFDFNSKLIPPNRVITVVNTDNDSVVLKLSKGVRYDEYIEAWKALGKYLGKGRRKSKKVDEAKRSRGLQMLGKREFYGLTYRQLAKESVKKIVKRAKKLRDGGQI